MTVGLHWHFSLYFVLILLSLTYWSSSFCMFVFVFINTYIQISVTEEWILGLFLFISMKKKWCIFLTRMKRAGRDSDHNSSEEGTAEKSKKLRTTSEHSQTCDWGNLLQDIILQVFKYLPLLDRAHASQVCRNWNQVFHMPDLWRCFEFELNQPATSYLKATHPELIKQIIKRHSNHLQYVSFKVIL